MGLRLATSARNASVVAIADLLDADVGAGTIKVYTGAQPANPNATATGTLLGTFTLADPAFGSASNGSRTIAGTPIETTGVADGTAGWFRALDNSGDAVLDGTVSATGGGGNLEINTVAVSTGLTLRITGGTITQPVGT